MFNEDEDWNDEVEVPSNTVVKANLKSNSIKQVKVSILPFKNKTIACLDLLSVGACLQSQMPINMSRTFTHVIDR